MSYLQSPMFAPQIVEPPPIWEMRTDESRRAYEAFLLYRDSDTRRLSDVAARLIPPCSTPNVARWSSRHQWQRRAWAWDKEQDRILQAQLARDRSSASKRHLQIAQEMQSIALHGLLELKARKAAGGALEMSASEIENMLSEAIKLERAVLGTDKDRRQYAEIRVFVGRHRYEGEEGHDEPQEFEELLAKPMLDGDEVGGEVANEGDGDEMIQTLPPGEVN